MVKLKPSERRLLILFVLTLLLVAAAAGGKRYVDRRGALLAEHRRLDLQWVEIETLIEERDRWLDRAAWLDEKQVVFPGRQPADEAVFSLSKARSHPGVRTFEHQFVNGFEGQFYAQAGVSFRAEGTMAELMDWLYTLQRPDAFRAIRLLRIAPSPDDAGKVVAEVELLQWYAPRTMAGVR